MVTLIIILFIRKVNTKKKYPDVFVKIRKVYIFVMQCPK